MMVRTMAREIPAQETKPTADRAGKRRNPGAMTAYSPEQIVGHATAAGRAAYAAVIRAGRATAVAERAYGRAYMRTIPPCWIALLAYPTPQSSFAVATELIGRRRGRERAIPARSWQGEATDRLPPVRG